MTGSGLRRIVLTGAVLLGAVGARALPLPSSLLGAPSQLLGGVVPPVSASSSPTGGLANDLGVSRLNEGIDALSLVDLRRQRLRALVQDNHRVLEMDAAGNPIRRAEIIAIDPSAADLAAIQTAGFRQLREDRAPDLGISLVVLAPPRGNSAVAGLKILRSLSPAGHFELNHVFEPAGADLGTVGGDRRASSSAAAPIGMVDGGVAAHPSLVGATIEQRSFASGGPRPTGHGTAIASLLVGDDGAFQGAARGRSLLVADVYGGRAASGSAEAIVEGFAWLASRRVRVITISLVGPPNEVLKRGVDALLARGFLVVAAVGNDGPAAPPLYPASYPGVVSVTAVDACNRALLEAGHASHINFAAPGADMAVALPGHGYGVVRGTSFAAPLVAARLALAGGNRESALSIVSAEAAPGKGMVGVGVVCQSCRVDPRSVRAKRQLAP